MSRRTADLAGRRAYLAALAVKDYEARCFHCKRENPEYGCWSVLTDLAEPKRFCSRECMESSAETAALKETR